MIDKLTNIYNYYRADKGTEIDIIGNHGRHFGSFYEPFFSKFNNKKINLLEIGIQCGPSILSHNDYFDHNVELYGIDIDYSLLQFNPKLYKNIHLIQGDSTSQKVIDQIKHLNFDIIIDDASHIHENMIKNLYNFHKLLTEDGIYILEDLHCDYAVKREFNNTGEYIIDFLLKHQYSNILTKQQNKEVLDHIDKVYIYEYVHDSSKIKENPIDGSSMTAILKMK